MVGALDVYATIPPAKYVLVMLTFFTVRFLMVPLTTEPNKPATAYFGVLSFTVRLLME